MRSHMYLNAQNITDRAVSPQTAHIYRSSAYTHRLSAEGNWILGPSFKGNWLLFSVLHSERAGQRLREKKQKGDTESNQFPRGFFNSRQSFSYLPIRKLS